MPNEIEVSISIDKRFILCLDSVLKSKRNTRQKPLLGYPPCAYMKCHDNQWCSLKTKRNSLHIRFHSRSGRVLYVVWNRFWTLLTWMWSISWWRWSFRLPHVNVGQFSNTSFLKPIVIGGKFKELISSHCLQIQYLYFTYNCFRSWLLAIADGENWEQRSLSLHRGTERTLNNYRFNIC